MRLFSFVVTNYTLSSLLCIKIWYGINVTMCSVVTGCMYEGWNFNSGNYLFTTHTK